MPQERRLRTSYAATGPREALELELARRRRLDGCLHRRKEPLADQDLAGRRLGAEPRGEIRHRAEHAVVVAAFEPDSTERGVAGLDADSEPQLRSTLAPQQRELLEPLLSCQREPDGLKLVVCHGDRIVEEHHDPIACEVLQRPVVRWDEVAECAVVLA